MLSQAALLTRHFSSHDTNGGSARGPPCTAHSCHSNIQAQFCDGFAPGRDARDDDKPREAERECAQSVSKSISTPCGPVDLTVVDTRNYKFQLERPAAGQEERATTVRVIHNMLAEPTIAAFAATDVSEHRIIEACHSAEGILVLSACLCSASFMTQIHRAHMQCSTACASAATRDTPA